MFRRETATILKFTAESDLLACYREILSRLESIHECVATDRWQEIGRLLNEINGYDRLLHEHAAEVQRWIAADPALAARYREARVAAGERITQAQAAIEKWKETQMQRLSQSKNVSDNLAKYRSASSISYYVDRQE